MSEGQDFGFCGSSYEAPNPYQDRQKTLNWYIEISQDEHSKEIFTLLGCPGKASIAHPAGTGEVRGGWVLPGSTQCLFVIADQVVLATVTVPATASSIAQLSYAVVGTLLTNSGQVCIRDNGAGGYAVIVDGPYGYYYRIAGAGSFTFVGGVANTSATVTFPSLPLQLLHGATISAASGFIPGGTTITNIDINGLTLTLSAAATGTNAADTLTVNLPQFARITDPAFLGSDRISFIDGWLIFNQSGTQNFYTNSPQPYTLMFSGSFFAKIDTSSDNLITHMENNREWWGIGERHSEVWYDAGGANFGFSRIPGVAPQIGCSAKNSIARLGDSLVWLGRSERGENVIIKTEQYGYADIGTRAVEHAISAYPLISDAFAFTYLEEGHLFYVLTFPTADATWVYDHTSSVEGGRPIWHQRASYNSTTGTFHRDRSNCFVNFQDLRLVGDYASGNVLRMSRTIYDDDGNPLIAIRRAPHVWSKQNRGYLFHRALQVEFSPGVGRVTGQGVNPQVMLKWTSDGVDSSELWTSLGAIGNTKNRAIWRNLGKARDREYEVMVSDPVNRDIVGATLWADTE
jgi:hypothetical protein